ncbi:MAG: methylenetetrahydrofolate reductase [Verrucomicrobiae bacterium]|nr:methylenetetrahydrofolate reductase [Verrucomicrobiae bacterium]
MTAKNSRLTDLLHTRKNLVSLEVFPPRTPDGVTNLMEHLRKLSVHAPDYISVTYGAGGGTQSVSLEILEKILSRFDCSVIAHFTCVGSSRESINDLLARFKALGVVNLLALRGDPPRNQPDFDFSKQSFHYANELVAYIKTVTDMCIAVAGYPTGHPQAPGKETDWDHLKRKADAGAEAVISQVFLDNRDFYDFRDAMAQRGMKLPIIPGVLPIPTLNTYEKIVSLCQPKLTPSFQKILDQYANDPASFRAACLDYSRQQIQDLVRHGTPGIHFYCLNRSEMVNEILNTVPLDRPGRN